MEETKLVSNANLRIGNEARVCRSLRIGSSTALVATANKSTVHELVCTTVVLHCSSGNGNGVANLVLYSKFEAVYGHVLEAFNNDSGVVVVIKSGDLTGKSEGTYCLLAVCKSVELVKDTLSIAGRIGKLIFLKSVCVFSSDELHYELAGANLFGSEVRAFRYGDGGVGAVGTDTPNEIVNNGGPGAAHLLVVRKNGSVLGREADELGVLNSTVFRLGSGNVYVDVILNAVYFGVNLVAAVNLFYEELSAILRIKSGVDELVLLSGVKCIVSSVLVALKEEELVSYAFNGSRGDTGVVDYGNLKGVRLACGLAVCIRNGSGKSVAELLIVYVGEINGVVTGLGALSDNNLIVVRGPSYRELNAVNCNNCNNVEVSSCSFLLILVDLVKERSCIIKRGAFCRLFAAHTKLVLDAVNDAAKLCAAGENTKAENGDED